MNRFRKAISVGISATMLASLLATVAAPAAFAALTSTTGGTIVPGGAASAAFTLTVVEDSNAAADQWDDGSFSVAVLDSANDDPNIFWVTSSVPTVTRNAGVGGATVGFVPDTLVVNLTGTDDTKIDSFTIGNLKVDSLAAAAKGAVIFAVTEITPIGLPEGLVPASGVTFTAITGGVTTIFTVDPDAGSPSFQVTGTACLNASAGSAGSVTVAASGVVPVETFSATAVAGAAPANQDITKATALTGDKPVGTVVTQTVCATRFPSAVTVGDAVDLSLDDSIDNLQAGVNNQDAAGIMVQLGFFNGLLQDGDTVTFTINTTGVLFSPNSCITSCVTGANITAASPTLGGDRKSITITLDETGGDDAATEGVNGGPFTPPDFGPDSILFDPDYDVALGVASGTTVDVAVTVSRAGVTVLDSPITVAVIGFVVAGSTAAPNVLIGQNDQSTGMIVLRESAAGSMGDGEPIDNDRIEVCLEDDSDVDHWSVGRYFWAVVTVGDLKLNIAGLPVSQGKMTIDDNCLWINIYTESTVASTIEIRSGTATAPDASGPLNGPKVNIDNDAVPGPVVVDVYVDGALVGDNIVIAVRAYSGTPIVTVTGQPTVVRSGLAQTIGSIILTEGAPNQFDEGVNFDICLVFPSVSDNGAYNWTTPVGINAPVVTTNSTVSGLLAFFDASGSSSTCLDIDVDDQSLGGLAVITLSNLKIDVRADAPLGAVQVRVRDSDGEFGFLLDQTVSPAKVGTGTAGTTSSRLGVTQIGAFTTSTKVAAVGSYVTFRFDFGVGAAGQLVKIWGATKTGNDWSAFTAVTSRVANASGVVYYYVRSNSATWKSLRAQWAGALTPARQARWN